jgi:hypothetical protein
VLICCACVFFCPSLLHMANRCSNYSERFNISVAIPANAISIPRSLTDGWYAAYISLSGLNELDQKPWQRFLSHFAEIMMYHFPLLSLIHRHSLSPALPLHRCRPHLFFNDKSVFVDSYQIEWPIERNTDAHYSSFKSRRACCIKHAYWNSERR